ncbi:MAG TPA: hypothetical protein VFE55_06035 [Acidimicrobiia bacterium]|nr:hypothetical protein [Acidimicrobiia bacterium]
MQTTFSEGPRNGDGPTDGEPTDDEVSDEELAALALAADPDTVVGDDAICLTEALGAAGVLLPAWYMPGTVAGVHLQGWQRSVALAVVAAFLLLTALGLCNTYGDLMLTSVG